MNVELDDLVPLQIEVDLEGLLWFVLNMGVALRPGVEKVDLAFELHGLLGGSYL